MRSLIVVLLVGCGSKDGSDGRPANPTCVAPARPAGVGDVAIEQLYPALSFDDGVILVPSHDGAHWYVGEQDGRLVRFEARDDVATTELVLDLTDRVSVASEMGLLGMALHPGFADNGEIFVNYTADDGGIVTRVSRFVSTDGGASFDPATEEVVLEIAQPFANHNAGQVAFGPDGYLYVGTGDGGSAGDPGDRAQDTYDLLGKMLRIDVDGGVPYGIPPDNPFADGQGGLPEVYAWGLRNPWRYSFDLETGELWVGDVGQNEEEEVDRVQLGGNYGWNVMEGGRCYEPANDCDRKGLELPEATYDNPGLASVMGGLVYRGSLLPSLVGTYLFSDFYSGDLYAVVYDPVTGDGEAEVVLPGVGQNYVTWAYGADGEAYLLDYEAGVARLVPAGGKPDVTFPETLDESGCFEGGEPVPGAIAYDVAHPFWSDGLDKRRWMALPDGTSATVDEDGDWDLPVGSVLVKELTDDGRPIETRLLVRHSDGEWAGYTYLWEEDGTARLLQGSAQVTLSDGRVWTVPSRAECLACHTSGAGGSLGLEDGQLGAQVEALEQLGIVELRPDLQMEPWPPVGGTGPLEERARTYLHVNCSICHRPDGGSRTDLDLRLSAAPDLCAAPAHGDLGVEGAQIVVPGDPSRSVLSLRMHRRDANGMPPLGSAIVDEAGVALIDEWIRTMSACP